MCIIKKINKKKLRKILYTTHLSFYVVVKMHSSHWINLC